MISPFFIQEKQRRNHIRYQIDISHFHLPGRIRRKTHRYYRTISSIGSLGEKEGRSHMKLHWLFPLFNLREQYKYPEKWVLDMQLLLFVADFTTKLYAVICCQDHYETLGIYLCYRDHYESLANYYSTKPINTTLFGNNFWFTLYFSIDFNFCSSTRIYIREK